jgi:hypothetical protein
MSEYTEILEEFKGPLITREGGLYDDKAYDETYKRRLRMREVKRIKEYITQVNNNEANGYNNMLEETISSEYS